MFSLLSCSPCIASDAVGFNDGDSSVPNIPLDVINDDDTSNDDDDGVPLTTFSPSAEKVGETTRQTLLVKGRPEVSLLQTDEVLETAVALISSIKSKEPGNQIDFELLIQLLRNPGMLEQMMKEHQLSANQESSSFPRPPRSIHNPVIAKPLSVPEPKVTVGTSTTTTWYPSVPFTHSMSKGVKTMIRRNSGSQISGSSTFDMGKIRKLVNEHGVPSRTGPVVINKDLDYYRRLISQHGTMTRENHNTEVCVKTVEQQIPCVYFNSPRGCRRGSSCRFQHVRVMSLEEHHGPKRMKLSDGNFVRHR